MKRSIRVSSAAWMVVCAAGLASPAWAANVVWDVDPAASYIRLTVPDQDIDVPNLGNATIRLRDANSTSNWTDAGGRRAALDGQIITDYVNFTSIEFLGGAESIIALEQTNLRPNPTDWSGATQAYTGTSTAPAALGARVRGTYIVTFDAAFMAFRNVHLDVDSSVIALAGDGTFTGSQSFFGIGSALIDADGIALPLNLGQPVPDLRAEDMPPTIAMNTAGGVVENLGGRNRKLTYNIATAVTIQLDTVVINGSAAGVIVAYATIPDQGIPFDFSGDGDVDGEDFNVFKACMTGPALVGPPAGCTPVQFAACDRDHDSDVDIADFGRFQRCYSGANRPGNPNCAP